MSEHSPDHGADDTRRRELLDRTLDDLDAQAAVEEALPLHELNTREGIAQVSDAIRAAHDPAANPAGGLDLDALTRLLDDLSLQAEIDADAEHGRAEGVTHAVDTLRDALDLHDRDDVQPERNTTIAPGVAATADPDTQVDDARSPNGATDYPAADDDVAGDGAAAAEQSVPDYDQALAALSPRSPVVQEISDRYEHLYDTWDDQAGPMPSWETYFVTVYEELRGFGLLTGEDAHLNTNTIDPATGEPFTSTAGGTSADTAANTAVDTTAATGSSSTPVAHAQDVASVEPPSTRPAAPAKPPPDAAAWLTQQAEVHDLIAHRARELGDHAGAAEAEVLACRARLDAAEATPRGRGHTTPPERAMDDAAAPAAHAATADREPDTASRE